MAPDRNARSTDLPSPIDRYIFANRLERRRSWVLALLVALLVLVALVVVAYRHDDVFGARLIVQRGSVERQLGPQASVVSVGDRGPVAVGDVIRTDHDGQAQVDYFDGSFTRVDATTAFKVIELTDRTDRRTIAATITAGRVWNSVNKISRPQDRFEVRTPHAWVSARGTAFVIDCRKAPSCTTIGIVDTTQVEIDGGNTVLLTPGQCATVDGNGRQQPCSYPREQLCSDPFTLAALQEEGRSAQCLVPVTTATPTPTMVSTPTPEPARPVETVTPTEAPTPVPTSTPTPTPEPSPTPTATESPSPTPSASP